jgi:hypothetical protein
VEQTTRFLLRINVRTARAMGIAIPRTIRRRVDEVIE